MIDTRRVLRVLTVCRAIPNNNKLHGIPVAEFIFEQNKELEKYNIEFDYYLIQSSGIRGYIQHLFDFSSYIKKNRYNYDIIHAHGGHIGSVVNMQSKIPVVTTYHGSDINYVKNRLFSMFALIRSKRNIFVSNGLKDKVINTIKGEVIPCGVDFNMFMPKDKIESRKILGLKEKDDFILFGGQKDRQVKNYKLAEIALEKSSYNKLIELKGFNRLEVSNLINACNCVLLTSFNEGSPMIIKEALACNCPIVSVDVGDVAEISKGIDSVFISDYDSQELAVKIDMAGGYKEANSRSKISFLDNKQIALSIKEIYLKEIKR